MYQYKTTRRRLQTGDTTQEILTPKNKQYRKNHVLDHIMRTGDSRLLKHPLILELLNVKWDAYGRLLYFLDLSIYMIFVILLNIYALRLPAPSMFVFTRPECPVLNPDIDTKSPHLKFYENFETTTEYGCSIACAYPKSKTSLISGNFLLTFMIGIRILYEAKALLYHGKLYLKDFMNYLEMVLYATSLFYIWGDSLGILKNYVRL